MTDRLIESRIENGVIFNNLGLLLTQISRARHYSKFNISLIPFFMLIAKD